MQYRIVMYPLFDSMVCTVTQWDENRGRLSATTELYTIADAQHWGFELVEMLAQLGLLVGERRFL